MKLNFKQEIYCSKNPPIKFSLSIYISCSDPFHWVYCLFQRFEIVLSKRNRNPVFRLTQSLKIDLRYLVFFKALHTPYKY